jgi:glutathione S-transferase
MVVKKFIAEVHLPMPPTITAFANSPDKGRGLARDMQVRWALEEAGQPYDVRLVSFNELKEPAHRARHPFGKIPTYEEGDLVLFESGAIVLHIAETHKGLLPKDAKARARAITWMFAALSTVEPAVVNFTVAKLFDREKPWFEARLPEVEKAVRERVKELSDRLGSANWLDGEFSAGDLMMIGVLRRLSSSKILDDFPNIKAYVARGEARPAFQRAFEAQLAVFKTAQASEKGGG